MGGGGGTTRKRERQKERREALMVQLEMFSVLCLRQLFCLSTTSVYICSSSAKEPVSRVMSNISNSLAPAATMHRILVLYMRPYGAGLGL